MRTKVCSLLATALLLSACDREQPGSDTTLPRLEQLEDALLGGGAAGLGAEDGPAAIDAVQAARLTHDGSRVVVLDRSPPFLKVFGTDGRLLAALVERGGGPGEIRAGMALAVDDDRVFLVEPGYLGVFHFSGQSPAKLRIPFPVLAVGRDCGGRLVGYGPVGQEPTHFIHVLEADSAAVRAVTSAWPDAAPRRVAAGFGGSEIIAGAAGSLVRHRIDGQILPIHFSCDGAVTERSWHWAVAGFATARSSPEAGETERRDNAIQMTADGETPTNAGIAELPGGELLWIERRPPAGRGGAGAAGQYRTEWHLADSTGVYSGYTAGRLDLQDVAAGSVLLSAGDPWPHLLVIPTERLLQMLRQGRRAPRTW